MLNATVLVNIVVTLVLLTEVVIENSNSLSNVSAYPDKYSNKDTNNVLDVTYVSFVVYYPVENGSTKWEKACICN